VALNETIFMANKYQITWRKRASVMFGYHTYIDITDVVLIPCYTPSVKQTYVRMYLFPKHCTFVS